MKRSLKIAALVCVLFSVSISADAQRYNNRRSKKLYMIGVESMIGTRTIGFSSNIESVSKIHTVQTGVSLGATVGTKYASISLKDGKYSNNEVVNKSIVLKQVELTSNLYFMQLMKNKKQKYFEAYLITGVNRGSVNLQGVFTPEVEKKETAGLPIGTPCLCPCMCGGATNTSGSSNVNNSTSVSGLPADPDNVGTDAGTPETLAKEEVFSDRLSSLFLNMGLGLQVRIVKQNYFANMFVEGKYGIDVLSQTPGLALRKTKANNQTSIDFGVRFGIVRRR